MKKVKRIYGGHKSCSTERNTVPGNSHEYFDRKPEIDEQGNRARVDAPEPWKDV